MRLTPDHPRPEPGPGDPNGAIPFLAVRVRKGGEMIAAGEPSTPVQYVDVRDMAEFVVRLIEKNGVGVYNAVGPARPATYGELIDAARSTVASPPAVTRVPIRWLAARKDKDMWFQVSFWHMLGSGGLTRMSTEHSVAAGFTSRPMNETLDDIARWYEQLPVEQRMELVVGSKRKEDGSAWVPVRATWDAYLARERETLTDWRSEKSPSA